MLLLLWNITSADPTAFLAALGNNKHGDSERRGETHFHKCLIVVQLIRLWRSTWRDRSDCPEKGHRLGLIRNGWNIIIVCVIEVVGRVQSTDDNGPLTSPPVGRSARLGRRRGIYDVISGVECGNRCQLTGSLPPPHPSRSPSYKPSFGAVGWVGELFNSEPTYCASRTPPRRAKEVRTGASRRRRQLPPHALSLSLSLFLLLFLCVCGWQSTHPIQVCTSGKDSLHISIGPSLFSAPSPLSTPKALLTLYDVGLHPFDYISRCP